MSKRNIIIEDHWRKNYKRLIKVVVRRVPNNSPAVAEEVVQEAYANALKYYRSFDPAKSEFNTWFETVLRNVINKSRTTEGPVNYQPTDDETPSLSVSKDERELVQLILRDIENTTGTEKDILTMFYFNGFRTIEIAEFMCKKHTTIRQTIFRWRNKIGLNDLDKNTT